MLRGNAHSHHPSGGRLAAFAGGRLSSGEFKFRKGVELFGEHDEAEYVYQIIYGAVRTYKLLSDGRRQINSFHLTGDIFGLESGGSHRFGAEAIIDTKVRIMRRHSLVEVMTREDGGAKNLLGLITLSLQHAENHMLLLGRKSALEKVAAFLLEMDERLVHPDELILPMNRRDIADYLGLTLETVSRSLKVMRDRRMLWLDEITHRKIVLMDRDGLAKLDA